MRIKQRLICLAAALPLLLAQLVFVTPTSADREFHWEILFIGNSLVRGIKQPLQKIFMEEGQDARIKAAAPGIEDLQYHAKSGRTEKIINSHQWDAVFLQQKSTGLAEMDGGYAAVRTLNQKINRAGSQAMMFMTWRERQVPTGSPLWDLLRSDSSGNIGYLPIAEELGIGVAPVGWAVRQARIELGDPPSFDLWKAGKGRHLSDAGHYLAACVVYSVLTGESPRGLWAPDNLPPQTADFLQTVAEKIVNDTAAWNLN